MNTVRKIYNFAKRLVSSSINKYNILVDHAGFKNRGAQLMLIATIEQIQRYRPDAQIIVPYKTYMENPTFCISNGILPLCNNSKKWTTRRRQFVYNKIMNEPKYITPDNIDLVLDAGGYQFFDQWKYKDSVTYWKNYYLPFSKNGRKIIFLPQAFGPFEQESSKEIISSVYANADHLYARDKISFEHLKSTLPSSDRVTLASDFTILIESSTNPTIQLPPKEYVLVIANARMIDLSDKETSDAYLSFMTRATQTLIDLNEKVILLNHEGLEDELLLKQINQNLTSPVPIVTHLSALDTKSIIKDAKLLICSRFHGVISGLTQSVPTLCTSWSHKYIELLKDHQCNDCLLDIRDPNQAIRTITDALANPKNYTSPSECNNKLRKEVTAFWDSVFK